ncbi:efflux ABC transporter, permease protein [Methylocaldum marinum]|uniref:Efflux ABC transporter, permease protein n=1 Tax=Methylocaldum marinum TaxID=1432792 RepID=A0A250L1C2_9GAMM|nr:ABC transporter permease [Methylocaldum marinum]BBA35969.1 efflux ABC transporter, permease protein [Methylocaldum marinum]
MLLFLRLALRNLLRHKLRTGLTAFGIVIAIVAFALLRTVVDAWYAGAEATSANRLITRNAISLTFPLPISHANRIRQLSGITGLSYSNWFGGVYIDERNFFPQFAVEPKSYLELYPELVLAEAEKTAFIKDRKGAIAGRKLAKQYGWKIGDVIPLRGTIYSGNWSFVLRGIYRGAEKKTDETLFLLHWDNLNETLKKTDPNRAERVGVFVLRIDRVDRAAELSDAVDRLFQNSLAETLTETEEAFQLGFVAMTEAILIAIKIVSFVVVAIIMAVMANTMAMSTRERRREYATLKAVGFGSRYLLSLILGESLVLSIGSGVLGILATFPAAGFLATKFGTLFPVFELSLQTMGLGMLASCLIGFTAALFPAWRVITLPVSEGLRSIG